jgi:uncharacterized protein (TIGR03435 family)
MNHLWQSSLFVLAAAITAAALRKNGAHIRHGVWVIASLKFLVPFSLLISVGSALLTFTPGAADIADRTTAAAPALPFAVDRFAQPFTSEDFVSTATMRATASTTNRTPTVLLAIWVIGLLAVAWTRLRGWQRIRALVRQSTPVALRSPLPIRSSPGRLEPGVVGIRRPVLLVPAGIEQRLTPSQLDAVFAHELCHVHRRDNLTAAIHMVVEAVFWFHPLVWWIGARMVDERERACDEYVLRAIGEPQTYAESILNVCKLYVESPLPCVSGVSGSDLKKRVAAIMVNRIGTRLTLARKAALALAAILAIALPLIVGMLTAPARASLGQVPAFEVVSVKACDPNAVAPGGRGGGAGAKSPGRLRLECQPLSFLIQSAYLTYANGRLNPPGTYPTVEWSKESERLKWERFTIEAKADGTPPSVVMQGPMLQAVLEDRFKLKAHYETREVPVYELVVAKGGSKLTPFKPGACFPFDWNSYPPPPLEPGQRRCENSTLKDDNGNWVLTVEATTLDDMVAGNVRGPDPDRPVVNKTGLTGLFAFRLVYENHDDFIAGLKNELGLELRAAKGPHRFLVIDHVERPTPNAASAIGNPPRPRRVVSR